MHVTIWQTDQGAGDAAACPKDSVGIGATGRGDGLMLQRDFLVASHLFQPGHHFGVIATTMRNRRTLAHLDVSVLWLIYCGVVGCVSDVHYHCHIWFKRVGNLPSAKQANLLLDV